LSQLVSRLRAGLTARTSSPCAHVSHSYPRLCARARRAKLGMSVRKLGRSTHTRGAERRCRFRSRQGGGGVRGAPAERARRLGAPARPNGGRARTLPRRGHPRRPYTEVQAAAPRSQRSA
jgi:hypothetical protein